MCFGWCDRGAKSESTILYTKDAIENDMSIGNVDGFKKCDINRFFPESSHSLIFVVEAEFLLCEVGIDFL
jgi:hypothetical protein